MLCIGKNGWPVELIKGHPIKNFFRKLIHTRSFYWGTIDEWNVDREEMLDRRLELALDTARLEGVTFDDEDKAKLREDLSKVGTHIPAPKGCCISDRRKMELVKEHEKSIYRSKYGTFVKPILSKSGCCCDHIRDNVRDPIQQAAIKNAHRKSGDEQSKCQG